MNQSDEGFTELPVVAALGEQFRALEAAGQTGTHLQRDRRRVRMIAAVCLAVAVAVGMSLTPPGRAAAGAIGELVGIGDEPSTVISFRGEDPAVLIGSGESPNGVDFELVAGRGGGDEAVLFGGSEDEPFSCAFAAFEAREVLLAPSCVSEGDDFAARPIRLYPYIGPSELGAGAELLVTGEVAPEAIAVTVTYEDGAGREVEAPTTSAPVDEQVIEAIGVDQPYRFFVAFLPSTLLDGLVQDGSPDEKAIRRVFAGVEVTSVDASGTELASRGLGSPDYRDWLDLIVQGLRSRNP